MSKDIKLAPVRYGAVRPGTPIGPIEAVKTTVAAFVDDNGVNLGMKLTDDQALRLLTDLSLFGWKIFAQRPNDPLFNNPELCLQVLAAVTQRYLGAMRGASHVTMDQEGLDEVKAKRMDFKVENGALTISLVDHKVDG